MVVVVVVMVVMVVMVVTSQLNYGVVVGMVWWWGWCGLTQGGEL